MLFCSAVQATGLASTSFPVDEMFVVGWAPPSGASSVAFEVQVGAEIGEFTWSSGNVASEGTNFELPQSVTATWGSMKTYKLRVRVWPSATGPAGDWSSNVYFDTTPNNSWWSKAQWIGGGSELGTFWTLPSTPIRARAYVSGLGVSELSLNNVKVGEHYLDPGEAVYDQAVLFVTHNITNMVSSGHNEVTAKIGNSKYGYLDIYVNRTNLEDQSGDSSRALKLFLFAEFADGTSTELVTEVSSNWQARHGPIVYDHLWHGEM